MRPIRLLAGLLLAAAASMTGCAGNDAGSSDALTTGKWSIALHGGAGFVPYDIGPEKTAEYERSLSNALRAGAEVLDEGGTALDAVEVVVRILEDDPLYNAGRGAVFTADGGHELDASIMDGSTHACGAVTGVRTVRHPITLARRVMERSRHVFFAADGAEHFADSAGVERVETSFFDTERRRKVLEEVLAERAQEKEGGSTVGCVALDTYGNVAAATSTGGMTAKAPGRIGDSPIIGAGTYASNRSCAVSCTGVGEQYIRNTVARDIAALVEFEQMSAEEAATLVHTRYLDPRDGGAIVVSRTGEIALVFTTRSMLRGAADSSGRFDVAIWE